MDPKDLPDFVKGDLAIKDTKDQPRFGLADLHSVNQIAQNEFRSKDSRYHHRHTYAMRIGYNGDHFVGYQKQSNLKENTTTVEDCLRPVLKKSALTAAGRTDKGVHAISQVVDFIVSDAPGKREGRLGRSDGSDAISVEDISTELNALEVAKNGHLRVYEIYRVPRQFNARSQATWRRYLYLFPINENDGRGDVDVNFVNKCLNAVIGKELRYAALSYNAKVDATCQLFKAEAFVVDVSKDSSYEKVFPCESKNPPDINWTDYDEMLSMQECINALRRKYRESEHLSDRDHQAEDIELSRLTTALSEKRASVCKNTLRVPSSKVMCIELVGNRFLRRMVRIIAGTVIRESTLENRNEEILLDICNGTFDMNRMASVAIMGEGLCFCGVGFDLKDLALYKMIPKREKEAIMARDDLGISKHDNIST